MKRISIAFFPKVGVKLNKVVPLCCVTINEMKNFDQTNLATTLSNLLFCSNGCSLPWRKKLFDTHS